MCHLNQILRKLFLKRGSQFCLLLFHFLLCIRYYLFVERCSRSFGFLSKMSESATLCRPSLGELVSGLRRVF
jgi:hypothetical protein